MTGALDWCKQECWLKNCESCEYGNAVKSAIKDVFFMGKVIDIVNSNDYPEYKEDDLIELIKEYNNEETRRDN